MVTGRVDSSQHRHAETVANQIIDPRLFLAKVG
jgi:hypothetical protein